jgi:hypothetical protein
MKEGIKISHVIDTVDCYGKVQANDFCRMQVTLTKLITVYVPIGTRDKECLRKKDKISCRLDATTIDT